jgi:hypothetical protein
MKMEVFVNRFYPEEFKRKSDAEKYSSKGTCEVHLSSVVPIGIYLTNMIHITFFKEISSSFHKPHIGGFWEGYRESM